MSESKCPVTHTAGARKNRDWWPHQLNLTTCCGPQLRPEQPDGRGVSGRYAEGQRCLDLAAVKKDLTALMTDSQDWWPADFGHYGGLFIRPLHGIARGHRTSHRRRSRWRRWRTAALCAAQLLAG